MTGSETPATRIIPRIPHALVLRSQPSRGKITLIREALLIQLLRLFAFRESIPWFRNDGKNEVRRAKLPDCRWPVDQFYAKPLPGLFIFSNRFLIDGKLF